MTDLRTHVAGLITAAWTTQVVYVAAKLALAERLAEGPRAAADLAQETGSHTGALRRLLRAMAALHLVRQLDAERFELTPAGELLRGDAPGSVRGVALHWGQRLWGALSQLEDSVATGRPWQVSGLAGFQHMASDPGQMAMFHQSMTDQTLSAAEAILQAYDFSAFSRIVDVGGSYGALLAAVLQAHPRLSGEVFDLPDLEKASSAYLESAGVADRARFVGGSFFEEAPPAGADAYLLKMIIHDWADAEALAILQACRAAAGERGLVLVMERIAPELAGPDALATIRGDMLMLTAAGGVERTEAEYRALMTAAGLAVRRIVPTGPGGFSLIEAAAA